MTNLEYDNYQRRRTPTNRTEARWVQKHYLKIAVVIALVFFVVLAVLLGADPS